MTFPTTPDPRRRFNDTEHAALYLAADGKCTNCGVDLEPGWHADHVTPHARGGPTDVTNGQALCGPCNLAKGSSVLLLRPWQNEALRVIDTASHDQHDFLICATPGAGKTIFASVAARNMLDTGSATRVVVIAPTDALREQWADEASAAGLNLKPVTDPADYEHPGFDGCVTTYQQLARGAGASLLRRSCRRPTVAIIDEAHHAGDKAAWGEALRYALEPAVRRILLSGTPWRRDRTQPIPFVAYDESGAARPDYVYGYGTAVVDEVCRRVEFLSYDGTVRWVDAGKVVEASLGTALSEDDTSPALDAAFDPSHEWMPGLLAEADKALGEVRVEVPDAGGLVVANSQPQARKYADLLARICGEEPVLVLSEDADAKERIDTFRRGHQRWMVAVRMVSEGVDVKRLIVGVYASKTRTPLFFRQVVGRFVRVRDGEQVNARLYLPAVPSLLREAQLLEQELLHQLRQDEDEERKARAELAGGQMSFEMRQALSASPAEFYGSIYQGDRFEPDLLARAQRLAAAHGIPATFAVNLAAALRAERSETSVVTVEPAEARAKVERPLHRRVVALKAEVDKLAGKVAYRAGVDKQQVNTDLLRHGFPSRSKATYDDLVAIRAQLAEWLGEV